MTWFNVADGAMPNEQEIVEVQLTNGTFQLARFSNGMWRVPTVNELTTTLDAPEIKNVLKWRFFAEAKLTYQQKKTYFIERPY